MKRCKLWWKLLVLFMHQMALQLQSILSVLMRYLFLCQSVPSNFVCPSRYIFLQEIQNKAYLDSLRRLEGLAISPMSSSAYYNAFQTSRRPRQWSTSSATHIHTSQGLEGSPPWHHKQLTSNTIGDSKSSYQLHQIDYHYDCYIVCINFHRKGCFSHEP